MSSNNNVFKILKGETYCIWTGQWTAEMGDILIAFHFSYEWFKVMLLSGKDKGKTGKVSEVVRSKNWVFVEGLNTVS